MTVHRETRVERPELTRRLTDGLEHGAVVLLADAGFGKTTALDGALAEWGRIAVWLRVTAPDRDPGRLVIRLAQGVRSRLPGVGEDQADRLTGAIEPVDVSAVAQSLVDDIELLLVEPIVVVVDDAEQLEGSPSVEILNLLLSGSADVLRVGICSRRPIGLRVAKLRATGRLLELGASDLAFSPAECAACIRLVRGREPDAEETEGLLAATDGWPLGVALAAAAPDGNALPGTGREAIFEFLAEEVFDGLDPLLAERLLEAAVVDELDASLEQGLGLPESFRDEVEAAGLLARSGDDTYALHPLLREFLRARLAAERGAAQLSELHGRVAAALAGTGRRPDAIEHWLAAAEFEAAAGAIAGEGITMLGTAPDTVARWLRLLPAELRERPVLRLLAGRLAMGEGDFDAAVEHCRAGVEALEQANAHEALLWSARLALTDAHIAAIDLEAAAEASAGAEDAGPDAGAAAAFCALAHAAALARLGAEGSDRALQRALERPAGSELLGPGLSAFQAHYRELPAGRLDDALRHVDEGIASLEAGDASNRLPYVLVFKMAIHEARGELEQALETFDATLRAAQRSGLAGYVGAGARLAGATMLALLGRSEEAKVQLDRVDRKWASWAGCDKHVARAVLASRAGDAAAAAVEAGAGIEEAGRMPPFDRVRVTSVLAPVLCEAGESGVAREALERLLEALGPGESTARTRAALACVLFSSEQDAAAHAALAAAFDGAGENARFFLRTEWPQIEPVLWSALAAGAVDPPSAIAALDAAFPGGPQVVSFAEHPDSAVRSAALEAAAAAGRPEPLAALADDDEARARLRRSPPRLAFRTLGRFEVRRGAWVVDAPAWERKVAERLVRMLLVRGGELVPEDELFEAFWPGKPTESARRGLQTAISSARAVLDLPWEPSKVRAEERAYGLALGGGDRLDADAFEAAADRALGARGAERLPALEAAAALWTGEPLPEERYSDWAASWRERLSSIHADVLVALTDARRRAGDDAAASRAARSLVDLDPLDERSQRLLMEAYAAAGRRGDALRQFMECRRALVEELGIEPEAETLALQRRILAGT